MIKASRYFRALLAKPPRRYNPALLLTTAAITASFSHDSKANGARSGIQHSKATADAPPSIDQQVSFYYTVVTTYPLPLLYGFGWR
mmetsp:Transcript_17676/g.28241  ORF Transcript_17676/g.28241 Transcript_17676/m.28241 type:complete len:86 (-) Transcript_17676:647-904(-)